MSKLKKVETEEVPVKPILITNATIKESICSYGYEINAGPCSGDQVKNRQGSQIVHEDMEKCFAALNVHLAILDDHFMGPEHMAMNMTLDQMADEASQYFISGFKVKGQDENESFTLLGGKYVKHGSISLESPKISKTNAYPFWEELSESMAAARTEVEKYMEGKAAPKFEQTAMEFHAEDNNDFENPID